MNHTDPRRTLLGVLLSAVVLGAVTGLAGDAVTLAVGVGVLLLVGVTVSTAVAVVTRTAPGATVPGAGRLRRQWGTAPMPMLDPGLAGNPRPRAPGRAVPEVVPV